MKTRQRWKLKKMYIAFMKKHEDLSRITKTENDKELTNYSYYLPHRGIFKENHTTTKLRFVKPKEFCHSDNII